MKSVSVLIPAYNCADVLPECLESLDRQSFKPLEILVIDDCSGDDTAKVASSFEFVRVIWRGERGGAGAARASGAKKARGDILCFIDSDCIAPPDWLEKIVAVFETDPQIGAVGGMYRHCHARSLISVFGKFEEEYLHHYFAKTPSDTAMSGGNMSVLKTVWDKARSGLELIHFKRVASSEDSVVSHEIRAVSKTWFDTEIYVSHMPKDDFLGFFRRNILRARTRMISKLNGLARGGDNLFPAFGGFTLFWAAAALWAAVLMVLLIAVFPAPWPWLAGASAAMLALHVALSANYFGFIHTQDERPCPVDLGILDVVAIRGLIAGRAACWVVGALLGILDYIVGKARHYTKIVLSIMHFWRPGRISKLFYFVTSKCNARCDFCFNLENIKNWKARQKDELTLNEIQKLAKSFGRLPYVTFSGGEPFARTDLPRVVKAFFDNARTMWVTIPTNGALTKRIVEGVKEILITCPGIFLTVQFSIDSLHGEHDTSRKIKGGFDSLLKTAGRLSGLRRYFANLRIQINTPYDTFNLDKIDTIRNFCKENIDFDQHFFYMLREEGVLISKGNAHLADGFVNLMRRHDAEERRARGMNLWGRAVRALQNITYADTGRIKKYGAFIRPCFATKKFITLYDDGTFTPCEVLDKTPLANIRDYDFDFYKMKRDARLDAFHKKEILDKKCTCEWMCAPPMNMLYDPPTWFDIAKGFFRPGS